MAVSVPSYLAPSLTWVVIGWRVVAPMNSSWRVNSHLTGRPVFSDGQHAQILGHHLLLAAEAAADALGEDVDMRGPADQRSGRASACTMNGPGELVRT